MTFKLVISLPHEPRHEKTCPMHMRKQTHSSAAQKLRSCFVLCFRHIESTANLHVCQNQSIVCVSSGL